MALALCCILPPKDCVTRHTRRFLANVKKYVIARPSVCRLSSVTFVCPIQAIEIFDNVLRHLVRWPLIDIQVKFYGDRPRGTPPSGELNTRGVVEYSDFEHIARYTSETVQDRSYVCIDH